MFLKNICTMLCKPETSKELILFKKCALPTCICRLKKEDRGFYPAAYFVYKKQRQQETKK